MEPLLFVAFFVLVCIGILWAPGYAQARREREMLDRMKALRDADEVAALLDVETREIRTEAESMQKFRGSR